MKGRPILYVFCLVEKHKVLIPNSRYYSNGSVVAEGMGIAVYDMAGKRVAQGHGSLSTASLQPGVYIVKAGASTLKITVK